MQRHPLQTHQDNASVLGCDGRLVLHNGPVREYDPGVSVQFRFNVIRRACTAAFGQQATPREFGEGVIHGEGHRPSGMVDR